MKSTAASAWSRAIAGMKTTLRRTIVFSCVINLLMLVAPLYMLQVYDRVLASRSGSTLLFLTIVAAGLLLLMGVLELIRSRILVRAGARFDKQLSGTLFDRVLVGDQTSQPLRDLDTIRAFATGPSAMSLLDAPWTPIYIAVIYLLHPWLGHIAVVGALLLFTLALLNDLSTRGVMGLAGGAANEASDFVETSSRNSAAVIAMGMLPGLRKVWKAHHGTALGFQAVASDRAGTVSATARFLRFFLQISMLGTGAYLAIQEFISAGAMIAGSIILGRALAPVEASLAGWRSFIASRQAYSRLNELLENSPDKSDAMELPPPKGRVSMQKVAFVPPGYEVPIVSNLNLTLEPGEALGIIGASGAGKTSLAKLIVGVWAPTRGEVRLDGVSVSDWRREELGPHIGFLPQEISLFPGTVAQNIARFGEIDADAVVTASKLAGAHDVFLSLPDGYDTELGRGALNLSGGQRQRIGLARAFYKKPPLVVLDEPTSNLDTAGENAAILAIKELKSHGSTVVVIAHRPSIVAGLDKVIVMSQGTISEEGPASEVLPRLTKKIVRNFPSKRKGPLVATLKEVE